MMSDLSLSPSSSALNCREPLLLETSRLQSLIKKYSDYIRHPIRMEVEDYRQKEKPEDAPEDLAMVPRFCSSSAAVMPMPLSETVRVRAVLSGVTVMRRSERFTFTE